MATHNFIRDQVFDDSEEKWNEMRELYMIEGRERAREKELEKLEKELEEVEDDEDESEEVKMNTKAKKEDYETSIETEKKRDEVRKKEILDKWESDKKKEPKGEPEFEFVKPEQSIEEWLEQLRAEGISPRVNTHFREFKDTLYKNTKKDSYTVDEVEAGLVQKDLYYSANTEDIWDQKAADKAYERGCKTARDKNAEARTKTRKWELLKREGMNDLKMEDAGIRFLNVAKAESDRKVDWHATMLNIKRGGEALGYDEKHFKHVCDRLVSFYTPQLKPIIETMTATETGKFLMNLTVPDTEYDIISSELKKLKREKGDRIQTVMSHLQALANTKFRALPDEEKVGKINDTMIRGLIAFTAGQTRQLLQETVDETRREKKTVSWERYMKGIVKHESIHGLPETDLSWDSETNKDTKLFNVSARPEVRPSSIGRAVNARPKTHPEDGNSRNSYLELKDRERATSSKYKAEETRAIEETKTEEEKERIKLETDRRNIERAEEEERERDRQALLRETERNRLEARNSDSAGTRDGTRRSERESRQPDRYTDQSANTYETRRPGQDRFRTSNSRERENRNNYRNKQEPRNRDRTGQEIVQRYRPDGRDRFRSQSGDRTRYPSQDRYNSRDRNDNRGRYPSQDRYNNRDRNDNRGRYPSQDRYNNRDRNDNRDRYPSQDRYNNRDRNNSRGRYPSQDRYNNRDRNDSRSRYPSSDRSDNRGRYNSRERQDDRDRFSRGSGDRQQSRDRFRRDSRSFDRGQRDSRQDSRNNGRRDSRNFNRPDRSSSRDRNTNYGRDNRDRPQSRDRGMRVNCMKCGCNGHRERECTAYKELSPQVCNVCNVGRHYEDKCRKAEIEKTGLTYEAKDSIKN